MFGTVFSWDDEKNKANIRRRGVSFMEAATVFRMRTLWCSMKECYDFSNGVKNPYAGNIKKEGYTVIVHYGAQPDSGAEAGEYKPSSDESPAFEEYRSANASNA